MAKITVSSSQVDDPTKPNVSSHFDHDMFDVDETNTAEERLAQMCERFGAKAVMELVKAAYTIALQAPARKELLAQWTSLSADVRAGLIKSPVASGGQCTAELPEANQVQLQARMDTWKLGEKATRAGRIVLVPTDPIKVIMAGLADGTLTGERLEEMRTKVIELLGITSARRR